jgi:DHA1 family bicyclomycin/chloramphenicol resistance-like MFS transporter
MTAPIQGLSRGLILLLAMVSALGPIAMQILLPGVPIIKESFGVSTGVAQLTLSLSMAAIALATLVYGPMSDRYGRRPVLITGISITIVGSILCVMAPTIELLIAGRVVQAAGGAVGLVVARAIVRDVYDARHSASVIATLVMVMVVMPMLSPAVGGELMVRYDWHSVFYLVAFLASVMLGLLLYLLPETLREPVPFTGMKNLLGNYNTLIKDPIFRGYGLSVVLQLHLGSAGDHGQRARTPCHGIWLLFHQRAVGLHDRQLCHTLLRATHWHPPHDRLWLADFHHRHRAGHRHPQRRLHSSSGAVLSRRVCNFW